MEAKSPASPGFLLRVSFVPQPTGLSNPVDPTQFCDARLFNASFAWRGSIQL
jgi:hypothetical protein